MSHPHSPRARAIDHLKALCAQAAANAQRTGLLEEADHLQRALRHIRAAAAVPPPQDVRQQFFAAMLERPSLL